MPSGRVQYQATPDTMIYGSYNRGFKAGGLNSQDPINHSQNVVFGPEYVNAYEIGLKSKWFDDRLLVNADVFLSNYRDLQVTSYVFHPATGTFPSHYTAEVRNAAQSRSQGIELETQWAVTQNLRLTANITYLESYYVKYPNAPPSLLALACGTPPALGGAGYVLPYCSQFPIPVQTNYSDASGQPTSFAPRFSGGITASYAAALPREYRLTTTVSPYFTSRFRYSEDADGFYPALGEYVRLDARLTLETPDGRGALDLIGKNLTNRVILTSLETKEEPRNVAIQFRYNFAGR
jgi:outer membrane receptor protein involved in Fe transport